MIPPNACAASLKAPSFIRTTPPEREALLFSQSSSMESNDFLSQGLLQCANMMKQEDPSKMDILKIEQKIKKIHKKRQRESKKIEKLENVYTSPQKEGFTLDFLNLNLKCNKKSGHKEQPMTLEKNDIDSSGNTNVTKESFREPFQESFGLGDIENKFLYLIDLVKEAIAYFFYYSNIFINDVFLYIPEKTRETIHEYSREINKHFSVEKADIKEKDSQIITDTIMKLLIFPLCVIVAYNWFYLTIMYDEFAFKAANKGTDFNNPAKSYIFFRYASDASRMKIDWGTDDYLNFFLYFTIKPLEVVDSFLFGDRFKVSKYIYFLSEEENGDHYWEMPITMPYLMSSVQYLSKFTGGLIPSRMTSKLIIFFFALTFIYQFDFFSVVLETLDNTKTNFIKGFCFAVILVFYFYYTIKYVVFYIRKRVSMDTAFYIKAGMIWITWAIIYATIRLSIALASVSFSALIIILYVWFHFVGAIFIYGENEGMLDSFNKMNLFIDEEILSNSKECYEDRGIGNWKLAFRFFRKLIIFINDNLVTLGFLWMLYQSYNTSQNSIVSETVKNGFGYLFILIAIIVTFMFVWPNVKKLFSDKRIEYKVADDPGTYVAPDGTKYNSGAPIKEYEKETELVNNSVPEKNLKGRMYDKYTKDTVDAIKETYSSKKVKRNVLEPLVPEVSTTSTSETVVPPAP